MAKNKKVIKEQKKYQNLQERYEEMNDYLLELIEDHRCAEEDLRYLNDFIRYKKLDVVDLINYQNTDLLACL